jgi:hypothetical protein
MALFWRVVDIPESVPQDGGDPIVLWKEGVVRVDYAVYDDGAPATVLHSGNRQFPSETTDQEMIAAIGADVSKLKAAFDRRQGLLPSIGATFPVE